MKRTRFTEERTIGILKEHPAGLGAQRPCRKQGVSDATFYGWRARFGAMEVSGGWRLKALETEHAKLKKMLAAQMMELATLGNTGKRASANARVVQLCEAHDADHTRPVGENTDTV